MMKGIVDILFVADVFILAALIGGSVWSVAYPVRKIWPPPGKKSWQHRITWICFYLVFGLNILLLVFDWNSWFFGGNLRLILGLPLVVLGALLVTWGIVTLGVKNTSGMKEGFVSSGPYRFPRNPQYVGDMILFMGLSMIANSRYLRICHTLTILVFILTPLAEEIWLEEQYREQYLEYKRMTPRFL